MTTSRILPNLFTSQATLDAEAAAAKDLQKLSQAIEAKKALKLNKVHTNQPADFDLDAYKELAAENAAARAAAKAASDKRIAERKAKEASDTVKEAAEKAAAAVIAEAKVKAQSAEQKAQAESTRQSDLGHTFDASRRLNQARPADAAPTFLRNGALLGHTGIERKAIVRDETREERAGNLSFKAAGKSDHALLLSSGFFRAEGIEQSKINAILDAEAGYKHAPRKR